MSNKELFCTTKRILFGGGVFSEVADEVKTLGGSSAIIVTDPGLVSTGMVSDLEALLAAAELPCVRFDKVEADPRYELVSEVLDLVRIHNPDLVIGFGGGSALDIAKVAAVMSTNPGPISAYFGVNQVPAPGLPLMLIPTTAGTGSEMTPIAILSDEREKIKKGIVSPYLFPGVAMLDPELTLGLPPALTAATGMDALIHAIEAFTSVNATPMSDMLAKEAIRVIFNHIRTAYACGRNLEARTAMLRGSMLAGMAFATAGVTAVHAFAYPIGAKFHIPHGVANAIMLLPVMAHNLVGKLDRFAELAALMGDETRGLSSRQAAIAGLNVLRELIEDLRLPRQLRDYEVEEKHIPDLAQEVLKVDRLLANNPRELTLNDAEAIYRHALQL